MILETFSANNDLMGKKTLYRKLREIFYRSRFIQYCYRHGYVKHLWMRFGANRLYKPYTCIEISNICNARCVFCVYPEMLRVRNDFTLMKESHFQQVLQHVEREKLDYISLTPDFGEILCNPKSVSFLSITF